MRVTYSDVKKNCEICGVEFATATAKFPNGAKMSVSDRMSKFKLFQYIEHLQNTYSIGENEIDLLLILIKEDGSQKQSESEID